jgi:hypothetical protein
VLNISYAGKYGKNLPVQNGRAGRCSRGSSEVYLLSMQTERRSKPRMYAPVQLRVRGTAGSGESYDFETVARNIGAGGVCAAAPRVLQPGDRLSLEIRFALAGSRPATAPVILTYGVVLRSKTLAQGRCIFAATSKMVAGTNFDNQWGRSARPLR